MSLLKDFYTLRLLLQAALNQRTTVLPSSPHYVIKNGEHGRPSKYQTAPVHARRCDRDGRREETKDPDDEQVATCNEVVGDTQCALVVRRAPDEDILVCLSDPVRSGARHGMIGRVDFFCQTAVE